MEDWRERLRDLYLEENSEIRSPNSILFNWGKFLFKGKAYQNFYLATQDSIEDFIEQELSKAREEGRREYFSMGMEYFSLIDDSNIYQQKGWKLPEEKAKRLQILDKIFNLILKTKEDEK